CSRRTLQLGHYFDRW
nr:immunoglobulin heavy chain junction region [Macaca mulatta]